SRGSRVGRDGGGGVGGNAGRGVGGPPKGVEWGATAMPPAPTIAIGYDEKISLCEAPHLRAADDMPKQSPAHHAGKGDTMRKSILFVAVVIITATAAVWSIATFARSKVVGPVQATETPAPVSPQKIMIKQGRPPPVEYWPHPF